MARGKQKYRKVVGKIKNKKSSNQKNKNFRKKKTFSLYQKDKPPQKKTKFDYNNKPNIKTNDKATIPKIEEYSSSESDEEFEDHMQKLRQAFQSNNNKKSLAIDSSDDSMESDVENEEIEESMTDGEEEIEKNVIDEIAMKNNNENENDSIVEESADECEVDIETIEEDIDNSKDPFVKHLFYDLHENLLNSLTQIPPVNNTFTENWPKLGKLVFQIPQFDEKTDKVTNFGIDGEKLFTSSGTVPKKIDKSANPADLFIKSQIVNNLRKANKSLLNSSSNFTNLQSELFSIINNYQDLLFHQRTFDNANEIRFVYCLHAVNHILKTRTKVLHHNAKLSKKDDVPEEFRDQGLVRPKILIIVPFKDSAYKIIRTIIDILFFEDKGNVIKKNRFIEEYTGNELAMPKKNPKPEDYEMTFTGNTSDDFRIGLTVTKKSLKLYANFYSSDIIVASPLGLRTIIGAEGEPNRDFDFLASLELLILDQTELFLIQNWDHLIHVFNHMHLQPKESHGTDFSRVRTWSLNGWSKYYRQSLIFSSLLLPEINGIFNKKCSNYAGKVKVVSSTQFGSISQVFVQLPHVFHKFQASSVTQCIDARFDFFVNKILPQQRDALIKQTLIYISNYFDYVRLRNYFKKEDIGFVQICEYSKEGKVARARDMFYHGDANFLLYTERHHFFNRIRIKGIRHLVFYQPPNFPHFFYEMCNLMQEGNMNKKVGNNSNMTISVLYSKYDVHQLSAIVGTERAAKMLKSDRNVHMMVTGAD